MIPVVPGMKIGCHIEVFKDGELVHTSRPGEVCGHCGQPLGRLLIQTSNGPLCVACAQEG